jgi:4-hydroxy-tetrahydrodipicolinate synthase
VTPFKADLSVDESALRAHIQRQLDAGIDGIVPCGTTGETPTLTMDEYKLVVSTTVEVVAGRVPVIAGTGSNNTVHTIEWTRTAKKLGVDAALVVTPYYNKPGPSMLEAHYRALAEEGGLPIVLYNVPGRTGSNMLPSTTAALSALDSVIAIKEACGSLSQVQEILSQTNAEQFTVVSGDDALALPMYAVGSHGVISVASNVVPADMKAIHQRYSAGDVEGAAAINARLFPLFQALFCESNPVPCKAALSMLGHMNSAVRPPLGSMQESSVKRVRSVMTGLQLL